MNKSYFIISLDTEMGWGPTNIENYNFLRRKDAEIRNATDFLLNLFNRYSINATWAIVGHLFLEKCNKEHCLTWKNINKFNYHRDWYNDPYSTIEKDPLFYGKDIIEKILCCNTDQEIGYHSFSHPRFIECKRDMIEQEIKQVEQIRKKWNLKISSFVYPRDEIIYPELLKKYNFTIYRGKKAGFNNINRSNILIRKFNNSLHKLITSPVIPQWRNGIWEIKSSMFFCDTQIPNTVLNRAKFGLNRAIKTKNIFHIFLHPWSLLLYNGLKYDIEMFLNYVSNKIQQKKLEILTMGELAERLNEKKV